jgi:hypothetical protein
MVRAKAYTEKGYTPARDRWDRGPWNGEDDFYGATQRRPRR